MRVIEGNVASLLGFSTDDLYAGLKKGRLNFSWIISEVPANVAGVYATNKVIAASLIVIRNSIKKAQEMKAVVVNSGVANSCTGVQGVEDAYTMQKWTAEKSGVEPDLVGVASTGVIGGLLPMNILKTGLSKLVVNGSSDDFSKAILTTDTIVKTAAVTGKFGRDEMVMAGIAKDSGMIHPNIATMLAFTTCDVNISSETLQLVLGQNVGTAFNQITADSDTSTNDMVLVLSNGCTLNEEILPDTPEFDEFSIMLNYVMQGLAEKIAKNGEGASKLIKVNVKNTPNALDARMMTKSVVSLSLVKTTIFGEGPNWGCILAAVDHAGVDVLVDNIDIYLGDIPVTPKSSPADFETEGIQDIMHEDKITIMVDLRSGEAARRAWGCDLSYNYVRINALYRT